MSGVLVTAEVDRQVIETDSGTMIVETPLIGPEGPPGDAAQTFAQEAKPEPVAGSGAYVWFKVNSSGELLDILTGVA